MIFCKEIVLDNMASTNGKLLIDTIDENLVLFVAFKLLFQLYVIIILHFCHSKHVTFNLLMM